MALSVAVLTPSEGLSSLVTLTLSNQPDIDVSIVAAESDTAIQQLRLADVAVLHHRLPRDLIFKVLRALRYLPGKTESIIAGAPKAVDTVANYLEHGATGYTLEGESQRQLIDVVRMAGSGRARLDPWLAPRVIERYRELHRMLASSRSARFKFGLNDSG